MPATAARGSVTRCKSKAYVGVNTATRIIALHNKMLEGTSIGIAIIFLSMSKNRRR